MLWNVWLVWLFAAHVLRGNRRGNACSTLTFAHIAEPDVPQRASALAVDALELPGADDDVGDGRAVVEDEHGAVATRVGIGVAGSPAVELFVAEVDGAGDGGGLGERDDRTGASGDVEGLGGREGCQRGEEGGGVQHCNCGLRLGCVWMGSFWEDVSEDSVGDGRVYISSFCCCFSCPPTILQVGMLHRLCALAQIERGGIDNRPGTNIVTWQVLIEVS